MCAMYTRNHAHQEHGPQERGHQVEDAAPAPDTAPAAMRGAWLPAFGGTSRHVPSPSAAGPMAAEGPDRPPGRSGVAPARPPGRSGVAPDRPPGRSGVAPRVSEPPRMREHG